MNSSRFDLVVLAILDGWGIAANSPGNAITKASTPNMTKFWASYPHTQLEASGQAVGLPRGEAGNTETGHLNLGAGKIIYQDLERINMSIADGAFFENKVILDAFHHAIANNSDVHLMGLVGAGGVHSNIEHLFALIQIATKLKFKRVYVHIFTDGRDSPPTSGLTYIKQIDETLKKEGVGEIASIMGRYWAMDRDLRWERTEKAYFALTKGNGVKSLNYEKNVRDSYAQGKTDEFIEPIILTNNENAPKALIKSNDAVIFFNFRIDRPRQLTKAFVLDNFNEEASKVDFDPYLDKYLFESGKGGNESKIFERGEKLKNLYFATMTEYSKKLVEANALPAFPPEVVSSPIASAISVAGKRQFRITESEKERFVTFYFNGLRENPYEGEERTIIPSPRVPTYDQAPEMSSVAVVDTLIDKVQQGQYSFAVVNFPNVDMVGHTGNLEAAVKAVEAVDTALGKLASHILSRNACLVITADHGNAEEMINTVTGEVDTEHSSNKVPFIAIAREFTGQGVMLQTGILADVATTILPLLDVPTPTSMTGRNLLSQLDM